MLDTQPQTRNSFDFWKKILLTLTFFILTPLTIGASIFSLNLVQQSPEVAQQPVRITNFIRNPQSGVQVYASLPDKGTKITTKIQTGDARPELIRNYLSTHESPLEPLADFIVQTADKYAIDYRLTTAIAQQESNLCKKVPENSYNCWGWGIHSKGTLGFNSFEEGIDTVSQGIKFNYIDEGYVTPDEIMQKYTPLSNGSWAFGVNLFMSQMQ